MILKQTANYTAPNGNKFKSFILDERYYISTFNNKVTVVRDGSVFGREVSINLSLFYQYHKFNFVKSKTIIT
jgi:hypothetical protein